MSIILSRDIVLTDASVEDPNAGHIGYHTLLTFSNVTADSEETENPARNLANVATNLFWRSLSNSEQYLTVAPGLNAGIDYVGFANHNFGSGGISYQVQGSDDGVDWEDIGDLIIPDGDGPHMQIFPLTVKLFYRIKLTPSGLIVPRAAVIYLGKCLVLQRRTYVGHTPITMGRDSKFSTNISESGQFLGRVVKSESLNTALNLKNLTPEWYRTYFDPFAKSAATRPFFWAWRPVDYPLEVGYCWTTDDIVPKNQSANGMMETSFKISGIGSFIATDEINNDDYEVST